MSENCKLLVLQYKCNIEIFLSPDQWELKSTSFLTEEGYALELNFIDNTQTGTHFNMVDPETFA